MTIVFFSYFTIVCCKQFRIEILFWVGFFWGGGVSMAGIICDKSQCFGAVQICAYIYAHELSLFIGHGT